MAKIPFTLGAWLKDKSQRVETRDGRIVHDIWPLKEPLFVHGKKTEVCALIDGEEDALVFFEGGKYLPANAESPFDLFIVMPEPTSTSEFEMKVSEFAEAYNLAATNYESEEYKTCNGNLQLIVDKYAAELLSLAIDARARELSKGLNQSKLDKDSIPYHLIEFMCNLFDCQNWKEIEETAELYVTRIKAAAMKDLPRWNTHSGLFSNPRDDMDFKITSLNAPYLEIKKGNDFYYVRCSELLKLPGFKED